MMPFHVPSKVFCVVLGFVYTAAFFLVKYYARVSGMCGLTEEQAIASRPFLLRQLSPCSCEISCLVLSGKLLLFSVIPLHVIAPPEEFSSAVPTGAVALL